MVIDQQIDQQIDQRPTNKRPTNDHIQQYLPLYQIYKKK